jgi:molecular chaperone DnaK (HSP70)
VKVGIDFGTTRTVVAAVDRGNYPVVAFEGPDGEVIDHWPSLVATDGTELLFGPRAAARLGDPEVVAVRSIKRLLVPGRPDRVVEIGPVRIALHDLLVGALRVLRDDLVERSNAPGTVRSDGRIEAWVAVPAGAGSGQRMVTLDAFAEAGFEVAGLLNEPSAAGLEYAHRFRKTLTSTRDDVLVYDLGGGTFDASLVRVGGDAHDVRAHAGDNRLGGDDFDEVLLAQALAAAGAPDPSATTRTRLLEHCRQVKEALRPTTKKVVVDLDGTSVTLPVGAYYDACAPLVGRTLDAIGRILPAGKDGERFDLEGLAGVYVVGGASDLPLVSRLLKEVFGRRVKRSAYASASTAVGLAIALDGGALVASERFSRTFGVFRETEGGIHVAFDAILGPDDEVAATGGELRRRYRAAHNVGCFRFAECAHVDGPEAVGDLLPWGVVRFPFVRELQGRADLDTIAVERLPSPGPLVEERYTIDPAGVVRVSFTDLESGFSREHQLGVG